MLVLFLIVLDRIANGDMLDSLTSVGDICRH